MKASFTKEKRVLLELTVDEVALFTNALNEVCNGFQLTEFENKIGATEEEATIFLKILSHSYDKAEELSKEQDEY